MNEKGQKEGYLTVPEVADLLGVSRHCVYSLTYKKEIEFLRIGTRKLIPRTALERFIEEHTVRCTA